MAMLYPSLVLLLLPQYTQAENFKPNCTIPPPGATYVSGPNTRGTTTILWNCLSIIFLCTWNIQHLNIPAGRPRAKSWLQSTWWAILDSRTKIKWMIFTILVPEYLVGKAFGEWLAAKEGVSYVKRWYPENVIEWETVHVYMANMGYFVVDFRDLISDVQSENETCLAVGNAIVQKLIHQSHIPAVDRYIGDKLVKGLALAQIIYLIAQLAARKIAALPSTQLEIAALAFSASSMITYIFYWGRPQGVNSMRLLKAKRIPDHHRLGIILSGRPVHLWTSVRTPERLDKQLDLDNFSQHLNTLPLAFRAVIGGTLFGGVHCLAWNFHFPTPDEQLAWRFCSVLIACLPTLSIPALGGWMYLNNERKLNQCPVMSFLIGSICILLLAAYILARLFLIVEIFRSLFFLPLEAYIETWSGNFPHFG
ncbi:uncharacterized protein LY89DRAFT_660914 [Mollisia scopiformis]|uniref:Uncharacterized protein n=1 Tax=Mollisia scopiformis TaxID=149040 RepID=A0A132B4A4_MOLSC|nr:uncharacterized protein LY89DRAFT_660914 [Mollisia scopiformis]KUJ07171.1 hypothetical protein LY89DRAFT_660914 [Mollisia scopiformis]